MAEKEQAQQYQIFDDKKGLPQSSNKNNDLKQTSPMSSLDDYLVPFELDQEKGIAKVEQKKVFVGQALFVAIMTGTCSFLNGYYDNRDFAVSTLNFSGFLCVPLIYKIYTLLHNNSKGRNVFFTNYITDSSQLDKYYLINTLARAANFLAYFWLIILSMSCAQKANLNFGIISSCAYISIVINCGVGYVWFREVITLKMLFGIVVTLSGIIWISLAKGSTSEAAVV